MPKRIAVELKCDRCPAVWFEDYVPGDPEPATPSVKIHIERPNEPDLDIQYEVLCKKCVTTISNYIKSVHRDPNARRKPRAKKKEEAGDPATSSEVMPLSSSDSGRNRPSVLSHARSSERRTPSNQTNS